MSDAPKGPPRTVSNPGTTPRTTSGEAFKVMSAQRMAPLSQPGEAHGPLSSRLKEGAADTALNVVGILRDLWDDFRSSDQFFKYKALILATWILLSGAGFVVACPPSGGPSNNIGARLVTTKVLDTPVFMIVNESGEAWEDVVVVVNNQYRAAVARVSHEHPDNNLTLEPKKLLGAQGQPAPSDLRVTNLQVRTSEGKADLIVGGQNVE